MRVLDSPHNVAEFMFYYDKHTHTFLAMYIFSQLRRREVVTFTWLWGQF